MRLAAVRALSRIAEKGHAAAIQAVCRRLGDAANEDGGVRAAAMNALGQIAERGNAGAMEAVCQCLVDANAEVGWDTLKKSK